MSPLCALPSVTAAMMNHGKIAIFTANRAAFEPMHDLVKDMCCVETHSEKYVIVGCEDVPGFEPIFEGGKLDIKRATRGIIAKAKKIIKDHQIRAFFFECTQ